MPDIIAARGQITADNLRQLLSAVAPQCQYLLWQTDIAQEIEQFPADCNPASYLKAYAFGPRVQLHWQRERWLKDGLPHFGWRVVFSGDATMCPPTLQESETKEDLGSNYQIKTVTVKLWGERRTGQDTWLEPRIPRRLDYPYLHQPRWLGIAVTEYILGGRVAFSRYIGLTQWPAGDEFQ